MILRIWFQLTKMQQCFQAGGDDHHYNENDDDVQDNDDHDDFDDDRDDFDPATQKFDKEPLSTTRDEKGQLGFHFLPPSALNQEIIIVMINYDDDQL